MQLSEAYSGTMTARVQELYDALIERSMTDRSGEWFTQDMLPDVAVTHPNESVIMRRSYAIEGMLKAMTDLKNSKHTLTAWIAPGDLLLGTLPMGSNGLGKVFVNYLYDAEKRAGSITNRSSMSLLGHNSLNYHDLVNNGLQAIIDDCNNHCDRLMKDAQNCSCCHDSLLNTKQVQHNQHDFYQSVKTACQGVIDYASRMADIAELEAENHTGERGTELLEMARIARKVPKEGAENFYEALQSIWFFHLSLHASMNFISLGRLDQILNPFLEQDNDPAKCCEIFECFLIKAAWRLNLNLTPSNIVKQDHVG